MYIFSLFNDTPVCSKIIRREAGMSTAMRAKLLLIFSEPLLILHSMSSMSAVLAPNDHALT